MSSFKINIAANFAGSAWQAFMGLLFIPLYIKFMGMEAFGLIGFFAMLQPILNLMDMGISVTLNREMARLSALPGNEQEMRDLSRSLEVIYWLIAVLLAIGVISLSSLIANRWVNPGQLSAHTVERAIMIMGLVVAFQWPSGLYTGGLMGLQKQVLLNFINSVLSTFKGAGAVLVLWLIAPTVKAFFLWQLLVSIINAFVLAWFFWSSLPAAERAPRFKTELLSRVWKFAAGMSGMAVLITILNQTDKIVLSKLLTLEAFGYYMLAWAVAMTLNRLVGPVFSAVSPKLTQFVAAGDLPGLKQLYHKSSQLVAILTLPAAFVLAFFSYDVLLLWTQNAGAAENSYILLSLLIAGAGLNALLYIPYALQLAYGWVKLGLYVNLAALVVILPLILAGVKLYGAPGGAAALLILTVGNLIFSIQLMHTRLLSTEKWRWYSQDVIIPLFASAAAVGVVKLIAPAPELGEPMMNAAVLVTAGLMGTVAVVFCTPLGREQVLQRSYVIRDLIFAVKGGGK